MQTDTWSPQEVRCSELVEEVVVDDVGHEGEEVAEERNDEEKLPAVDVGPGADEKTEENWRQSDWNERLGLTHFTLLDIFSSFDLRLKSCYFLHLNNWISGQKVEECKVLLHQKAGLKNFWFIFVTISDWE